MKNVRQILASFFAAFALAAAAAAFAAEFSVVQQDLSFSPGQVALKVGDRLTFINSDEYGHNVYSSTPGFEFDIGLQTPGQNKGIDFKSAGVAEVRCRIHPRMRLTVNVSQ